MSPLPRRTLLAGSVGAAPLLAGATAAVADDPHVTNERHVRAALAGIHALDPDGDDYEDRMDRLLDEKWRHVEAATAAPVRSLAGAAALIRIWVLVVENDEGSKREGEGDLRSYRAAAAFIDGFAQGAGA